MEGDSESFPRFGESFFNVAHELPVSRYFGTNWRSRFYGHFEAHWERELREVLSSQNCYAALLLVALRTEAETGDAHALMFIVRSAETSAPYLRSSRTGQMRFGMSPRLLAGVEFRATRERGYAVPADSTSLAVPP